MTPNLLATILAVLVGSRAPAMPAEPLGDSSLTPIDYSVVMPKSRAEAEWLSLDTTTPTLVSPDHRYVLERLDEHPLPWFKPTHHPVYLREVAGTKRRLVIRLPADEWAECLWSPDSKHVLVDKRRNSALRETAVFSVADGRWVSLDVPRSLLKRVKECSCTFDLRCQCRGVAWIDDRSVGFEVAGVGLNCLGFGRYIYHLGGRTVTVSEYVDCARLKRFGPRRLGNSGPTSERSRQDGKP